MRKLFVVACSILILFGCSQSSPPAVESSPEAITTDSSAESQKDEAYKNISLGGYVAKIPSDWIVEDNYIYFNDRHDFPVAMSLLLTDYNNLDDLFSYDGSKEEFIADNGEEIFDSSPSSSEMEEKTYGNIPALSFNMTGIQDGQSLHYIYNLFDNPGGGVLIVTMCTDSDDASSAVHDYLNIFYSMEPALDLDDAHSPAEPVSESAPANAPDSVIESYIRSRISSKYSKTSVESITINDDLGTDVEGDYIALVNLTWDVRNSSATTEEMLQMYSDDLAASLAIDHPEVQEVAIFWHVPYLGSNSSKWAYERKDGGMYLTDKVLGF